MATIISKEDHNKLLQYHCDKGKHRYRENKFGIVWCVICGTLGINIKNQVEPLKEEEKLIINCLK